MMLLPSLFFVGCAFDENIPETDVKGRVVIPASAVTRTVVKAVDTDGDPQTLPDLEPTEGVEDPRLMGPVYIGAYSGIDNVSFDYPHPAMGPITQEGQPGDTYPYGGVTVGRLDFACYKELACRVATGRFKSYEDILDYFGNEIGRPVSDGDGVVVTNADTFQQRCFDYFHATSDAEMSFIGETDFKKEGDNYVADFTLNHTLGIDGMVVWGFMDAPVISAEHSDTNGLFSSCNTFGGRSTDEYNHSLVEGRTFYNTLNYPNRYIGSGDWMSTDGAVVHFDADGVQTNDPELTLDFQYLTEE